MMETTEKIFADRLKALRLARGFTQEQLADKIKVTEQTVKNWEKMRRWPEPPSIDAAAKALGCKPWELMKPEGDTPAEPSPPARSNLIGEIVLLLSRIEDETQLLGILGHIEELSDFPPNRKNAVVKPG